MVKNPYRFYTYAYLREDRTPYYIGKGQGKRLYKRRKRDIKPPKDKSRVVFLKQNITEDEAFKHEIYMIAVFGRKDLGTGILHNKTDGGDGSSNMSQETKEKIRKALRKYSTEEERREVKRKKSKNYYQNNKERISQYYKKRWFNILSKNEELREKIREKSRKPKEQHKINKLWKKWRITFDDGRTLEMVGLYNWCKENGYSDGLIYQVAKGTRNKHKDIVSVVELEQASSVEELDALYLQTLSKNNSK